MYLIDHLYLDGAFVPPHGSERLTLINPSTEAPIGEVVLADAEDARRAVAAARRAQAGFGLSTPAERLAMLQRLHDAVLARQDALRDATLLEYGGPVARSAWVSHYAAQSFLDAAQTLRDFAFERRAGSSTVLLEPVGPSLLITPWNSSAGSVCSKLATAIAAGCTSVIKPSEWSALQTQVLAEAFHAAGLPPGVVNILHGRGEVLGPVLATHPDIPRISFTGSGPTGLAIARQALDSLKRVTLGLGGKSPSIVLDDADLDQAIPAALAAAFQNSGQACIAGSRMLVPRRMMPRVLERLPAALAAFRVGPPDDPAVSIGPMANRQHFERVQGFIQRGLAEGATLVAGGPGRPEGLPRGYFVRPTVFADVRNDMAIAREEIFGPVLCLMGYDDVDEAIAIANDSPLGLHAYVFSTDVPRARAVARRLQAGRVAINRAQHDPLAPFGGYKQSGTGREFGPWGLESFLEVKAVLAA